MQFLAEHAYMYISNHKSIHIEYSMEGDDVRVTMVQDHSPSTIITYIMRLLYYNIFIVCAGRSKVPNCF